MGRSLGKPGDIAHTQHPQHTLCPHTTSASRPLLLLCAHSGVGPAAAPGPSAVRPPGPASNPAVSQAAPFVPGPANAQGAVGAPGGGMMGRPGGRGAPFPSVGPPAAPGANTFAHQSAASPAAFGAFGGGGLGTGFGGGASSGYSAFAPGGFGFGSSGTAGGWNSGPGGSVFSGNSFFTPPPAMGAGAPGMGGEFPKQSQFNSFFSFAPPVGPPGSAPRGGPPPGGAATGGATPDDDGSFSTMFGGAPGQGQNQGRG